MTDCPHCGEVIDDNSVICRLCHSGISDRWFQSCPFCTKIIAKHSTTCKYCKKMLQPETVEDEDGDYEEMEQRFRGSFLTEIGNLMMVSLGVRDAIHLIANVLGKRLQLSRCLIYCTYGKEGRWYYREYWHGAEIHSCTSLEQPPSKSALVAKSVLAQAPFIVVGAEANSQQPKVQKELTLLGIQSFLGVALPSDTGDVQGCLILHQCDYSRVWEEDDIAWTKNVARVLADSLATLSAQS